MAATTSLFVSPEVFVQVQEWHGFFNGAEKSVSLTIVFDRDDPYRKEKIAVTMIGAILFLVLVITLLLYLEPFGL